MSDTAVAFLGAIAVATLIMAAIQIGLVVFGAVLARRISRLVTRVEQDLAPMVEKLTAASGEASRAASLAAQQVERVDRLATDVSRRVDRALAATQRALIVPAQQGVAVAAGVKAAVGTLRDLRRQRRAARLRGDDEDPLFIG